MRTTGFDRMTAVSELLQEKVKYLALIVKYQAGMLGL